MWPNLIWLLIQRDHMARNVAFHCSFFDGKNYLFWSQTPIKGNDFSPTVCLLLRTSQSVPFVRVDVVIGFSFRCKQSAWLSDTCGCVYTLQLLFVYCSLSMGLMWVEDINGQGPAIRPLISELLYSPYSVSLLYHAAASSNVENNV